MKFGDRIKKMDATHSWASHGKQRDCQELKRRICNLPQCTASRRAIEFQSFVRDPFLTRPFFKEALIDKCKLLFGIPKASLVKFKSCLNAEPGIQKQHMPYTTPVTKTRKLCRSLERIEQRGQMDTFRKFLSDKR